VHRYRPIRTKVRARKNSYVKKTVVELEPIHRELTWAEPDRLRERTMVERVYSRLKDGFGARTMRVRGAEKIMAHLLFGVLTLTVDPLLKLAG
jgi:DDE family transposase